MNNRITLLIALMSMGVVAQKSPKVDLDRFSVVAEYQNLPNINIPLEDRVYFVNTEISEGIYNKPDSQNVKNQIYIEGWKLSDDRPTVTVSVRIEDFTENRMTISERLVEEKGKDGKVIKKFIMYKAVSSYSGRANIYVSSTFSITKEVEPNKKEEKNRFLTPKTTETITGESDFDLNESLTFSTKEYRSSSEAEKEYKINRANTYNNQLDTYVNHVVSKVNKHINIKFGFEPRSQRFILWILDSKEEEGQIQKDAIEAVKIIFNEMKADVPLDAIEEKLLPIISYFESLKTKYPEADKGSKKIRYAAYYNLGKIYYYLDQPEKAIKEGQGLIENGYDKKDGEEIIEDSERLIEMFKTKNFTTRHNISLK